MTWQTTCGWQRRFRGMSPYAYACHRHTRAMPAGHQMRCGLLQSPAAGPLALAPAARQRDAEQCRRVRACWCGRRAHRQVIKRTLSLRQLRVQHALYTEDVQTLDIDIELGLTLLKRRVPRSCSSKASTQGMSPFLRCLRSAASEDLMQRLGQDMFNPLAPYQSQTGAAALPPQLSAPFSGASTCSGARSSLTASSGDSMFTALHGVVFRCSPMEKILCS